MNGDDMLEPFAESPQIEALGRLASVDQMVGELADAASRFGATTAVIPLHSLEEGGGEQLDFLVNFKEAQDAIAASREWRCYHFGYTSVLVPVRRRRSEARFDEP